VLSGRFIIYRGESRMSIIIVTERCWDSSLQAFIKGSKLNVIRVIFVSVLTSSI
jgi:hypothetical protein